MVWPFGQNADLREWVELLAASILTSRAGAKARDCGRDA